MGEDPTDLTDRPRADRTLRRTRSAHPGSNAVRPVQRRCIERRSSSPHLGPSPPRQAANATDPRHRTRVGRHSSSLQPTSREPLASQWDQRFWACSSWRSRPGLQTRSTHSSSSDLGQCTEGRTDPTDPRDDARMAPSLRHVCHERPILLLRRSSFSLGSSRSSPPRVRTDGTTEQIVSFDQVPSSLADCAQIKNRGAGRSILFIRSYRKPFALHFQKKIVFCFRVRRLSRRRLIQLSTASDLWTVVENLCATLDDMIGLEGSFRSIEPGPLKALAEEASKISGEPPTRALHCLMSQYLRMLCRQQETRSLFIGHRTSPLSKWEDWRRFCSRSCASSS